MKKSKTAFLSLPNLTSAQRGLHSDQNQAPLKQPILLEQVNRHSLGQCEEVVHFLNEHLVLGLPIEVESVRSGKIVLFWAYLGKERVGVTGYYPRTQFLAESAKTTLHPKFRGMSLGAALSQAIEDEIVSRGFRKIVTAIYVTNLPMIFIKLKQGYFFEGFHRDHDRPGLHEYSLGKTFPASARKSALQKIKLNRMRAESPLVQRPSSPLPSTQAKGAIRNNSRSTPKSRAK